MEQREGRIIRQGNNNENVKIFKYVTKDTFDSYNWATVERKQKFIGQVFTSKSPSRSADDVDATALSYAEIKALATEDPRIKEVMELGVEVKKLTFIRSSFMSNKYSLEDKIEKDYPVQIENTKRVISKLTDDNKVIANHNVSGDFFKINLLGKTYDKRKNAGSIILNECKKIKNPEEVIDLGNFRGMDMNLSVSNGKHFVTFTGKMNYSVELESDEVGNIQRLDNVLKNVSDRILTQNEKLETLESQLESAKKEVEKIFPQEDEFIQKSARLSELTKELEDEEKGIGKINNQSKTEMENDTSEIKSNKDEVSEDEAEKSSITTDNSHDNLGENAVALKIENKNTTTEKNTSKEYFSVKLVNSIKAEIGSDSQIVKDKIAR